MSKLPIGIQTFEKIRKADQIYVDKTDLIYQLANGPQYVFLSRPRRFGKSLLISTLDSYFRGKRELFEGLKIADLETEWRTYPVIRIDLAGVFYREEGALESGLRILLERNAVANGLPDWKSDPKDFLGTSFSSLIEEIYRIHGPVVVLIDEYDKALVNVLDDMSIFERNQAILAPFYGVLKSQDDKIRFGMLTGVSQFAKLNIFSGLNNLWDISTLPEYANIVGFSLDELNRFFPEELRAFQRASGMTEELFEQQFRLQYNGYSWNGVNFLHNPFSVLSAMQAKLFRDFWYYTGGTTFLTQLIVHHQIEPEDIAPYRTAELIGRSVDPTRIPLPLLLFQTGYLTIKERTVIFGEETFTLDYPNGEVRRAFFKSILQEFAPKTIEQYDDVVRDVKHSLRNGQPDALFSALKRLFASIPARLHLPYEAYYHSMVYLFLRMAGFQVQLERETSQGRIDGVVEMNGRTFIIEFKFAKKGKPETLSQKAIDQIRERAYFEAYRQSARELVLLGVGVVQKALHGRWEVV